MKAAQGADAVVLVVGIDQSVESEGHDRDTIDLPGHQNDLIAAVAAAANGPVIVVVMAGGSVDLSMPKQLEVVHSMLWVGYPGQSGGQALADIIFGTVPPGMSSGCIPRTPAHSLHTCTHAHTHTLHTPVTHTHQ